MRTTGFSMCNDGQASLGCSRRQGNDQLPGQRARQDPTALVGADLACVRLCLVTVADLLPKRTWQNPEIGGKRRAQILQSNGINAF